jgi:predicted amidohydrolase
LNKMNSKKNLVNNPKFLVGESQPDGWSFLSPRPEIAPEHNVNCENNKTVSLILKATGDSKIFGWWRGSVDLEVGKWYKASVRVKVKDIENPSLSILATVARHYLIPKQQDKDEILLEQIFKHGAEFDGNDVDLYLRSAEAGEVEWFAPCVVEVPEPEYRMARVATIRFGETTSLISAETQRQRITEKLDQAGALKPDIAAFPEFTPVIGTKKNDFKDYYSIAETAPDGPVCRILSDKAKQYRMYVMAGMVERRGKYLFNSTVLFDREGNFIGQYDKTHLTYLELCWGFSCGCAYPVFDLDFGRIGIHTCYDEWFPEVARYYAHQGAEILFLPVAGGKPITWRTRALDNGIYFVSSSITPPSMIIDSSGAIIAQTHGDGIAVAELNLTYRQTNVYLDPTLAYGMPCIVPQMRNVVDNSLLKHLSEKMKD